MKEHPILFSGEMVRAILDGRKTQTRRVIKLQPPEGFRPGFSFFTSPGEYEIRDNSGHFSIGKIPYGTIGDRLWVRETWHKHSDDDDFCTGEIHYRATEICVGTKWIPSIFMPRWASRITLEVVNVRVERVQDICFEDCLSEGCDSGFEHYDGSCNHIEDGSCCQGWHYGSKWNFRYLWDSINAKRGYGWDANPWVWVIEFRRVE